MLTAISYEIRTKAAAPAVTVNVWSYHSTPLSQSPAQGSSPAAATAAPNSIPTTLPTTSSTTPTHTHSQSKKKLPAGQSSLNIAKRPKAGTVAEEQEFQAIDCSNKMIVSLIMPQPTMGPATEEGAQPSSVELSYPARRVPLPLFNVTETLDYCS